MESDERFRRARSFHLMFMGAVLLYILIAVQHRVVGAELPLRSFEDFLWVARIALATLAAALVASVAAISRWSASAPNWRQASPPQRALALALVRATFGEAIGIYGLLLFLMGGHFADLLVFTAASFGVLAWWFPQRGSWDRDVARFESAP